MFNARTSLFLAFSAALALGSPALSWSPLQYDTAHEVDRGKPTRTVYDELMDKARKDAQQAEHKEDAQAASEGSTEKMPDDKSVGHASADQAQSVIEKDAPSDGRAEFRASLDDQDSLAAKPLPAYKPPTHGKMPHEDILDPEYFYKRAHAFAQEGDYQSALNYINRSLTLSPNFWAAAYEKGLIYQLSGYDAAAARRYISLLDHKPDFLAARVALGMLYRKHGNRSLAESEYRTAIELNSRFFPAHFNLANLLMDAGEMEPALKEYKVCLKLQPDNAHVHNNLGVIYQKRNFLEEAIAEFTAASHFDPASNVFATNLANARSSIAKKSGKDLSM
jgi:tetratricopeptide (TPR) repeat protein